MSDEPLSLEGLALLVPGPCRRIKDGWAVTCPACGNDYALWIRALYGAASLGCGTPDCNGDFATPLGYTSAEWDSLCESVSVEATVPASDDPGAKEPRLTANDIVDWILEHYRIGRSTDGLTFAVPLFPGSPRIAREVRSIRADVLRRFREDRMSRGLKGHIIGRDMLSSALEAVAAYAEVEEPVPVAIRSAQVGDDRVVLDLGDATGHTVEATPAGWSVREASEDTPLFRRSEATQPLPVPLRGGSLDVLRELLGLAEDDARWRLVRGWLVASLFSEMPRPLLWATGPQGSGKSTRAKMVLSLVEPAEALGKEPGRNERDDSTAARGRFLVSFDNITTVSQNTSDWLCRLVTGVTDDRRTLYSDDGLRPVTYRRSGVATSITLPPGLGSDALERISLVEFDRVPDGERRAETALWTAYEAAKPALLGALLDDVVGVLRHRGEVAREGRSWPRMADYAQVLRSLDLAHGMDEDRGHLAAYVGAVDTSLADRALDDPFAAAVISVVKRGRGSWRGVAGDLLKPLNHAAGLDHDRPRWWPTTPRGVATYLERSSEALRHAGVTVTRSRVRGDRVFTLTGPRPEPSTASEDAALAPF